MSKEDNSGLVTALGEVIGEQFEKNRKKAEAIPEVYTSGMRGSEKPPSQREDDKKKQQAQARKRPQTPAAGRDTTGIDEEDEDEDGNRVVKFKAKPKVKSSERIKALEKQVADLIKANGKGKKKLKI